ncbi:pantoate--beta-alanine ligase [Salinisphaera hydrothermalis]|uniref:Pantothenate synthetase n=1 Tax=Salinisphaera hydrothermalis (strain C41B8) TaxID=1304275 RepID=A0A084ILU1_SALHC|nr:pantoate--beta-alanine ligase [Salinisphaera hydrothermalis]KEZ77675.1 pantoate--beta-alanine ligase [Salinisphaera hydrothermalis C41B8]
MQVLNTIDAVREWRAGSESVGLVPTMGNLHAGHLALVAAARERCDRVIASIFVNPLQFGPNEDLATYPRTFDADRAALAHAGADAVFVPSVDEMYPEGGSATTVDVSGITEMLCGRSRPGHFRGVATVVNKLFNIVQPDAAFFGEKDYQQLAVIKRMVADLCMDVAVEGVPTVRDADGLAYSSRNNYLDNAQRRQALALSAAIADVVERLAAGQRDFRALEARGWAQLVDGGFDPDYFEIRAADLGPAERDTSSFRVLAAGHLGRTRLIDNMGVSV